eukprot:tig00020812_g14081.t1
MAPRRRQRQFGDTGRVQVMFVAAGAKPAAAPAPTPAPAAADDDVQLTHTDNVICGSIARGLAQTLLHPMDVLRTRRQAKTIKTALSLGTFAKGIIPCVVLSVPSGAAQFLSYETVKDKLGDVISNRGVVQLVAGAVGATCALTFRVPQEILKQRVQADLYPNALAVATDLIKTDGFPRGLYVGAASQFMRDVPYNTLAFVFFEQFKGMYEAFVGGRTLAKPENLALGGVSGALAAAMMTPVDVVKTRLMTQRADDPNKYKGIGDCFARIVKEEGPIALSKGILPRIGYLGPMAAVLFSVYEAVRPVMKARRRRIREAEARRAASAGPSASASAPWSSRGPRAAAFVAPRPAGPAPSATPRRFAAAPAPRLLAL